MDFTCFYFSLSLYKSNVKNIILALSIKSAILGHINYHEHKRICHTQQEIQIKLYRANIPFY